MLKNSLRCFLLALIRLVSYVYSYGVNKWVHKKINTIYTLWIGNFIDYLGEKSVIAKPCSLQGRGERIIKIGNNTSLEGHSILGCWGGHSLQHEHVPSIIIGSDCRIGEYNHITACNSITIGNGVLTGRYVIISDNDHGGLSQEEADIYPWKRALKSKGEVVIGDNVWIGDKVSILSGVHIGNNVIIAANAVVTQNVPSNCIVAGIPAHVVKSL